MSVRQIEYEAVKIFDKFFAVQITNQTHRGKEFGNREKGSAFWSTEAQMLLSSGLYPTMYIDKPAESQRSSDIYLRGECPACDDRPVIMDAETFERFIKAVEDYNKNFAEVSDVSETISNP